MQKKKSRHIFYIIKDVYIFVGLGSCEVNICVFYGAVKNQKIVKNDFEIRMQIQCLKNDFFLFFNLKYKKL